MVIKCIKNLLRLVVSNHKKDVFFCIEILCFSLCCFFTLFFCIVSSGCCIVPSSCSIVLSFCVFFFFAMFFRIVLLHCVVIVTTYSLRCWCYS